MNGWTFDGSGPDNEVADGSRARREVQRCLTRRRAERYAADLNYYSRLGQDADRLMRVYVVEGSWFPRVIEYTRPAAR